MKCRVLLTDYMNIAIQQIQVSNFQCPNIFEVYPELYIQLDLIDELRKVLHQHDCDDCTCDVDEGEVDEEFIMNQYNQDEINDCGCPENE